MRVVLQLKSDSRERTDRNALAAKHINLAQVHPTHSYVWLDPFLCLPWLIHIWHDSGNINMAQLHMTHSYVWHDSFMWPMTHSHVCHDSCRTHTTPITSTLHGYARLIRMCGMTHSYMWRDSFISDTTHSTLRTDIETCKHMCDTTHSCDSWLIHMSTMTHSELTRLHEHQLCTGKYDVLACVAWLIHIWTWLIHIWLDSQNINLALVNMTHLYLWHNPCTRVTWLVCMSAINHSHVWHASKNIILAQVDIRKRQQHTWIAIPCIHTYTCTNIKNNTYTYMHTYIHTYICAYKHSNIQTYMHAYIHACKHAYTHNVRTNVHTHKRTNIHTYMPTYIHTQIHTNTYMYTSIHTYTQTHKHAHTHTNIHTHKVSSLLHVLNKTDHKTNCWKYKPGRED